MIKARDVFDHNDDNVCIVSMNDKVDEMWGLSSHYITEEQIDELKNGKAIYFCDGEYAHLIAMKKEEQ